MTQLRGDGGQWTVVQGAGHKVREDAPKALSDVLSNFYSTGNVKESE